MSVSVLWLYLLLVGLQCVIVVFPDHTHLLFFVFGLCFVIQSSFKHLDWEERALL